MEGSVQFWIGDWLNYGHRAYERGRYEKALEELEYDYQTLRNNAWVARSIELSLHRDNLSFNHHKLVAPLEPEEQQLWLHEAEMGCWSVSTL